MYLAPLLPCSLVGTEHGVPLWGQIGFPELRPQFSVCFSSHAAVPRMKDALEAAVPSLSPQRRQTAGIRWWFEVGHFLKSLVIRVAVVPWPVPKQ